MLVIGNDIVDVALPFNVCIECGLFCNDKFLGFNALLWQLNFTNMRILYENTSLVNFGYRANVSSWTDMVGIYDQIASRIDRSIFNVAVHNTKRYYHFQR